MNEYLGEADVDVKDTQWRNFKAVNWIALFIEKWGSIDGEHHKDWLLDQIARISMGTPVVIKEAVWGNGHTEFRFRLGKPSDTYNAWVARIIHEDGAYEDGIAP